MALTGLHRPHCLGTDVHSWTTLDCLHLVRRASVVRLLHAAVAFQGLRSCGCGPGRNECSSLKTSPHREKVFPGGLCPGVRGPYRAGQNSRRRSLLTSLRVRDIPDPLPSHPLGLQWERSSPIRLFPREETPAVEPQPQDQGVASFTATCSVPHSPSARGRTTHSLAFGWDQLSLKDFL